MALINITIHRHKHIESKEILRLLHSIIKQNKTIIMTQAEMDDLITRLDTATNAIAEDLKNIIAKEGDKISPESVALMQSKVGILEKLGSDNADPVPVVTDPGTGTDDSGTLNSDPGLE